ncbi:hypothetical protein NEDG_00796 [Nematocida displodere]|uniref:Uncharacterized protein n=1 Tax=Nematocida displodere TaxID=1805483 RepID=A0A177ECH8_9MICR|nr:hypothetical protein NEDG_00796 [Nematocida displodere]
MKKEIQNLLEEVKALLDMHPECDPDDIHSKIVGIYLSLDAYTESDKNAKIKEYNEVVDRATEAGIQKIRKYQVKTPPKEETRQKQRGEEHSTEEADRLALSILEHSKTLKKKTESFGSMVDISKDLLDKTTNSVRKNVHNVEKGMETLERKHWWSFGAVDTLVTVFIVVLVFIFMYIFIRLW